MTLDVSARDGGVSFRVRATPRAKSSALAGIADGTLCVRVAAPPVEGKANEALRAFLADVLGVRAAAIRICSGDRSRHKVVEVRGLTVDAALRLLQVDGPGDEKNS